MTAPNGGSRAQPWWCVATVRDGLAPVPGAPCGRDHWCRRGVARSHQSMVSAPAVMRSSRPTMNSALAPRLGRSRTSTVLRRHGSIATWPPRLRHAVLVRTIESADATLDATNTTGSGSNDALSRAGRRLLADRRHAGGRRCV